MKNPAPNGMRVIRTARDIKTINKAAKLGYKIIMRRVEPSAELKSKFAVIRDTKTGEYRNIGDYRMINSETEMILDWKYYYPYSFAPFAAYVVPAGITKGEKVYLEDLIEDFVGTSWNQGNNYRLESCEAIWNGEDLEIQYDESRDRQEIIG